MKNHTPWRDPLKALTVGLQWQMFRSSNGKVNPSLWQQSKSPKGSKGNRAEIKPDITDLYKKNMSCWHYGTWLQGNTQEYSRKMCVRLTSMSLTQLTARAHGKEWWSEPKGTDQACRINERLEKFVKRNPQWTSLLQLQRPQNKGAQAQMRNHLKGLTALTLRAQWKVSLPDKSTF